MNSITIFKNEHTGAGGRVLARIRSEAAVSPPADVVAWWVALAAASLAGAIYVGFAPLSDPDLPMHLTVGEWIARHRTVPYVEPFAWTRTGAPYFAYSWLAELAFYELLRVGGPLGLHLLAGATGAAVVLAGAAAGRALGLRPIAAVMLGALNVWVAVETTPFLRPQLFMHVLAPLAWVCGAILSDGTSRRRSHALVSLFVISALAAGTHITFPAIAAALALPLVAACRRRSWSTIVAPVLAVLAGWAASPYAVIWIEVFRLNFAANALMRGNSPVGELGPGFRVSPTAGLLLGSLPLVARLDEIDAGERLVLGLLWLAGLLVFGAYFKGLSPWWWCSIPLIANALRSLPVPTTRRVAIAFMLLPSITVLAFSITNVRLYRALRSHEGSLHDRTLPSLKAFAANPAARWLRANIAENAKGRLLTTFSYGSYLRWRVPSLSESIDTRSIFPDSAALPDVPSLRVRSATGPWQSSDVAVVPVTFPVASLLDASPAWKLIGVCVPSPWAPDAPRVGLWVRRSWFTHNARDARSLPLTPLELH
jgi:hypothetical protein